jgi:ApeA N-terminal domain 1
MGLISPKLSNDLRGRESVAGGAQPLKRHCAKSAGRYCQLMDEAARTLAAEWTRTNDDGMKETITGTLDIQPDFPTHLIHLTRDFASEHDVLTGFFTQQAELDVYPVLHGQTKEGWFTAIDSRPVRSNRTFGGSKLSDIVLRPSFVIQGDVLLYAHELSVTNVTLRFWDQDSWAGWYNLRVKNGTIEDPTVVIEQLPPPTHSLEIDGVKVSLRDASQTSYFPIGHGRISVNQTSRFELDFEEEVPLRDFMANWMAPLSFWISSGTRRTSGIEMMRIHNRNWKSDTDGSPVTSWLSVIPRNPERKFSVDDKIDYLHMLKEFDFERQLPVVLDTFVRHQTAVEQYLDYIRNKPNTPMVRLTVLAQLVETFDRSINPDPLVTDDLKAKAAEFSTYVAVDPAFKSYAPSAKRVITESVRPSLEDRLRRLDLSTGRVVSDMLGRKSWKADVAKIRNAIVHGLPSSAFFLTNVIPIQISIDILEMLFELRLMITLGFTSENVKKKVTEDDPRWYGRKHHIVSYVSSFDDFNEYDPTSVTAK